MKDNIFTFGRALKKNKSVSKNLKWRYWILPVRVELVYYSFWYLSLCWTQNVVYSKISPAGTGEEPDLLLQVQSFFISTTAPCLPPPNNLTCALFLVLSDKHSSKTVCLSCIVTFLSADRLKVKYESALVKGGTGPFGLLPLEHPGSSRASCLCVQTTQGMALDCTVQGTRSSWSAAVSVDAILLILIVLYVIGW